MATAMVRRRPHAERSGRFRLSPGDVVFRSTPVPREGRATCGVFGAFFYSAPVCRTESWTKCGCTSRLRGLCSEMFNLRTPRWRLLLCAPCSSGLPFRRHYYLRCLRLLIRRSLNRFRRQWQAEYPMFRNRPRVTIRMYLSMNSRYTNLCCAEQLARHPLGTCLSRQPQLNAKMCAILFD